MEAERKKEVIRFVKFGLFSISAGILQMLSFSLLHSVLILGYWLSYIGSLVISVLWNFTINRKFTFRAVNNISVAMLKITCYYAVFTPISTICGDMFSNLGYNEYLILIVTMVINFITEFLYTRYFVYGKNVDNRINSEICSCEWK